jgi:hypothetical protein
MKHATAPSLDRLEDLLAALRAVPGLKEKARGVFYARSRAFLHFHEDPAGLFADVRPAREWERYPVNTGDEQTTLLQNVIAMSGVKNPHPDPPPLPGEGGSGPLPRKRGRVRVGV